MFDLNNSFHKLFNRQAFHEDSLDGIRAIAILWVIIFHTWLFQINDLPVNAAIFDYPGLIWITKGDLGVDLFFVLSGFLIGSILFKELTKGEGIGFKRFYKRRFFRLMPAYIFAMFIGIYFLNGDSIEKVWANLLYINNYVRGSYMGWTWSLAIEEQFYLIIPLLLSVVASYKLRIKKYIFVVLLLLPIVTKLLTLKSMGMQLPFNNNFLNAGWLDWFWEYYMLTHLRYGGLLIGVACAYLHINHKEYLKTFFSNKTLNNTLVVTAMVFIVIIASTSTGQFYTIEDSIFYNIPVQLGYLYEITHREVFYFSVGLIILSCIYSSGAGVIKPIKRFLSWKAFYPIAQISYSAYLFHEMFMFWLFPKITAYFTGTLTEIEITLVNTAIAIPIILVMATLMYLFIELPFMRLNNRKKAIPVLA